MSVSIASELRKCAALFRAFENGALLAEKLDGIESDIAMAEKRRAEVVKSVEAAVKDAEKAFADRKKALAADKDAAEKDFEKFAADFEKQKDKLLAEKTGLEKRLADIKKKNAAEDARLVELQGEVAAVKAERDNLVLTVEELKQKLRGMF